MNQFLTHILCCGDSDEDEDEDDDEDDCVVPVASGTSAYKTTRSAGPAFTHRCSLYVS